MSPRAGLGRASARRTSGSRHPRRRILLRCRHCNQQPVAASASRGSQNVLPPSVDKDARLWRLPLGDGGLTSRHSAQRERTWRRGGRRRRGGGGRGGGGREKVQEIFYAIAAALSAYCALQVRLLLDQHAGSGDPGALARRAASNRPPGTRQHPGGRDRRHWHRAARAGRLLDGLESRVRRAQRRLQRGGEALDEEEARAGRTVAI